MPDSSPNSPISPILPFSDVYLYGSYARGDYRPYSYVDIMLISTLPEKEIRARNIFISSIVGDRKAEFVFTPVKAAIIDNCFD